MNKNTPAAIDIVVTIALSGKPITRRARCHWEAGMSDCPLPPWPSTYLLIAKLPLTSNMPMLAWP